MAEALLKTERSFFLFTQKIGVINIEDYIRLDKLSRSKNGRIYWGNAVGENIDFSYKGITGTFKIIDYNPSTKRLKVIYKNDEYFLHRDKLAKGNLLALIYKEYYYIPCDFTSKRWIDLRNIPLSHRGVSWDKSIGMLFPFQYDNISGEVLIKEYDSKTQKLKIFIEDYTDISGYSIRAEDLKQCRLYNCLFTSNNLVLGKRPDLLNLLIDENDKYLNVCSNKMIRCKCPICGTLKTTTMNDLSSNGIRCQICKDGISYPEKFMISILLQLKIEFIFQLSKSKLSWCDNFIYDFYIPNMNIIIETHGMQHYNGAFQTLGGNDLSKEQANDFKKREKAIQNSISNYIVLDCRQSNIEWIKKSVLESKLPTLLNFSENDINWQECGEYATNSYVKDVCLYFDMHHSSITELCNHFKLSNVTIAKYLRLGTELGWCKYNPKYSHGNNRYKIQIFKNNISLGIFPSMKYIEENSKNLFGVRLTTQGIRSVIKGKQKLYKGYYFQRI